jgi:acyl transferase domain-containing protein/NAD(P)H-dependent flavin oxidoreductase YrpB (nitropropane dioxygenase family)
MLKVLTISPATLASVQLVIASTRAGGIGILDFEFDRELHPENALRQLHQILGWIPENAPLGLRFHATQVSWSQPLLAVLASRPHLLVLCGWAETGLASAVADLPASDFRQLILEVKDIDELATLEESKVRVDGIIGKGHESGGWVGDSPAFILGQQLLARTSLPVFIQGGIGPNTAAACYAAGAVGVVLDDQLWLMPESPFPRTWQGALSHINGSEATVVGERLGKPVRILIRPDCTTAASLRNLGEEIELLNEPQRWPEKAGRLLGWGALDQAAWPVGQAIGMAASFAARYRTTGRLIQAIRKAATENIRQARVLRPLTPDSPLARSHATRFPIVQGPMTRVSDVAAFANAVAQAGALPMLALALMRAQRVRDLLTESRQLLGHRSWGVGILGFVPPELREEQLSVIEEIKPPFAIIAGGRPEQADRLEKLGIRTYIHVPTPALLEMFLSRGARRFVFEGRECGGHVGPLTSFCLWESMIERLLEVSPQIAADLHVLFAGGIHDARSGAMISAMAAPLAARGVKVGVLMGTAYLFTREAVENGAVVTGFQQEALKCTRTVNLETGPGHASRCCVTPFAREFFETRHRLRKEGRESKHISEELEALTLGRLRVASKGILRNGDALSPVDETEQHRDGMYMIGQVAVLRSEVGTLAQLHSDLSEQSEKLISRADPEIEVNERRDAPSDIAIIGMSVLLPGAQQPETFWTNVLRNKASLKEIPPERWDWRLYYEPSRSARDKVYSKWGGFLDEVEFDPIHFGIPPNSLKSIETMQLLALEATRRALVDAGYERGDFDRERTSVIFGATGGMADLGQQYAARSEIPRMFGRVEGDVYDRLPEWTEESFPGLLFNVAAGRVANRFDFGGSNYTVDAACASSLAALDLAVRELESGRSNLVIAGGLDTLQSPFAYFCFGKTQALSPSGTVKAFDEKADGIVISEGIAIVVLKRLADAERDGDRIYAVLKAVSGSSDGRSNSMTAPAPAGQLVALRRAYAKAGFSASTLGLYEAHGTGTAMGDRAELESISTLLAEAGTPPKSCAVGSAKSLVGHTKSSAGIVGIIKAAQALYRKVLPAQGGVEKPLEPLRSLQSPVYLLKHPAPWLEPSSHPRRAAVSAFGFGGTNFHAVLEEHQGGGREVSRGNDEWPCELFAWRASDRSTLQSELTEFREAIARNPTAQMRDFASTLFKHRIPRGTVGLSFVASSRSELSQKLETALAGLKDPDCRKLAGDIDFQVEDRVADVEAKTALLFPGQGSQYPGMMREQALYLRELAQVLDQASGQTLGRFPRRLSEYLFPRSDFADGEPQGAEQELAQTNIAQPAIAVVSCGYLAFLRRLGLQAGFVAGHSFGEYTALYAANAITQEELLGLAMVRGELMANACGEKPGGMAAVKASREDVLKWLGDSQVRIANHNSPTQTVISGPSESLEEVIKTLQAAKVAVKPLAVAGAFHTPLMGNANSPLAKAILAAEMCAPTTTVFSNVGGRVYETDIAEIRARLCRHLLEPVEFVTQIEAMYAAGVRVFIEVGPRSVLTSFVREILKDRMDVVTVALDPNRGTLQGLLQSLGRLFIHGIDLDLTTLFENRACQEIDLSRRAIQPNGKPKSPAQDWLINGGFVRRRDEERGKTGKIAQLTSNLTDVPASTQIENPIMSSSNDKTSSVNDSRTRRNGSEFKPAERTEIEDPVLLAYFEYQETMREFLRLQGDVMRNFLTGDSTPASPAPPMHQARVDHRPPPVPPSAKAPSPSVPPAKLPSETVLSQPIAISLPSNGDAEHVPLEPETLIRNLLELVSERTGYPTEVLGLEQDMEADLGIDSIKRVEILAAFQNHLPPSIAPRIQESTEDFLQLRTLQGWIDELLKVNANGSGVTEGLTSQAG